MRVSSHNMDYDQTYWEQTRFGKLRMLHPISISPGSSRKQVLWKCDCGKILEKPVFWISTGRYTSCGKCNSLDINYWNSAKFGKLRINMPTEMNKNSSKRVQWKCDCGRDAVIPVFKVTSGRVVSCGKCDWRLPEYWINKKFGKLIMETPTDIHMRSAKRIDWICDCGNKTKVSVLRVTSGVTSSCGKCNWKNATYWSKTKFNKLKMESPELIAPHSDKKVSWVCDCGNKTIAMVHHVFSNATRSCGKCSEKAKSWFFVNRGKICSLRIPIKPDQIPSGWLKILEPILHMWDSHRALCGACGHEYDLIWYNIRSGSSLTCGCSTNRVSFAQKEIQEYISSLGIECQLEFAVGKLKYDIGIPSQKLLIEYQGLKWHSLPESRTRDLTKYENCLSHGYEMLSIFEDEWFNNSTKVKNFLKNRLGINITSSIRPVKCDIRIIDSAVSNLFYDKYHYIGKCRSIVNYGVFFKMELVACISFGKPTRQSKWEWEILRMASDSKIRIHGIWSKLLSRFFSEFNPSSIVSFSDNRLFSGRVYLKLGFKYDGDILPDYYWVKGNKRFHKSGLRKTNEEKKSGLTETILRESQGYKKIWDLGKKRWVWNNA